MSLSDLQDEMTEYFLINFLLLSSSAIDIRPSLGCYKKQHFIEDNWSFSKIIASASIESVSSKEISLARSRPFRAFFGRFLKIIDCDESTINFNVYHKWVSEKTEVGQWKYH